MCAGNQKICWVLIAGLFSNLCSVDSYSCLVLLYFTNVLKMYINDVKIITLKI